VSRDRAVFAEQLEELSEEAAVHLVRSGRLAEFLARLGYRVEARRDGFRGRCPACQSSSCFIGTGGRCHTIFWKCDDAGCESNTRRSVLCHNLLGLVRGLVPGRSLPRAIDAIRSLLAPGARTSGNGGRLGARPWHPPQTDRGRGGR
jgi:hypothetical protein